MPPEAKKRKLVAGQKTLFFTEGFELSSASSVESPIPTAPREPSAFNQGWDVLGTPSSRRGAVASWRSFAAAKWRAKHPWITVEGDGVYCLYCKTGTGLLSGSSVFETSPLQVRAQRS